MPNNAEAKTKYDQIKLFTLNTMYNKRV